MKTTLYRVSIEFGDCDPAGIVFFPNFSRWMDAASLSFFMQCGLPPWRELVKTRGIVGTPLLEIHTKFLKAATYGEDIVVHVRFPTPETATITCDTSKPKCAGAPWDFPNL
jgi:4-hydroxybenzoyl-CoA thioesterase